MADFNEDEIDKGFRRVIEGKNVEPPGSLWANIRISVLERQLIRYQCVNLWLKGTVGVLATLLSGTAFLYLTQNDSPLAQKEVVTTRKTDTVYLTRTERVFVNRPVVVYAENLHAKTNEINPNFNKKEQNYEIITPDNNPAEDDKHGLDKEQITQNDLIISTKQNNQGRIKNKLGITHSKKSNHFEQDNQTKNQVGNERNNTSLLQESSLSSRENEEKAALDFKTFTVNYLEPLPITPNAPLGIPSIKYHPNIKTALKLPKVRTPLLDRLSLSSYVSPEWNGIDVRRNEPKAFNYGDEELQAGITAGLRAGIRLSEKWQLLAGVEFSGASFDDRNLRQILTAEAINDRFGYIYRTALGKVEIPAEKLSVLAQSGSVVGIEIHEPIQRYVINVPLLVRYNVWDKQFRFLNQVPIKLQFYGLLGGYSQLPILQEGKIEVFENSGREFTAELTNFQNLRNSYGVNLGAGVELGIGKHFNLFAEPNYSQGISSLVREMPIRSVVSSFGVKMGAKWNFGK